MPRPKQKPGKRLAIFGVLGAASIAFLGACTPERRHAALTFLFDGVPPLGGKQDQPARVSLQYMRDGATAGPSPARPNMIRHRPYERNECARCHPKDLSFSLGDEFDRKGMCFNCHEHEPFKERVLGYAFLHGPVAIRNCLACHDPHESLHPQLLLEAEPRLCFGCHDRAAVLATAAHRDSTDEKCAACHDPHGGNDRYFLTRKGER